MGKKSFNLDKFWFKVMLCLISESYDRETDLVSGAVLNIRPRGHRISVWLMEDNPQKDILRIGQAIKKELGIDDSDHLLNFERHNDTITRNATGKNRYRV